MDAGNDRYATVSPDTVFAMAGYAHTERIAVICDHRLPAKDRCQYDHPAESLCLYHHPTPVDAPAC